VYFALAHNFIFLGLCYVFHANCNISANKQKTIAPKGQEELVMKLKLLLHGDI
jgi:hypothetical protein